MKQKKNPFLKAVAVASLGLFLCSCADTDGAQSGNGSTYYDGTISGMEAVTFKDTQKDDHTILGMVLGGLLGNLLNGHHGGTNAGIAIGGLIGHFSGALSPGQDGTRLSIDSDMGNIMVDVPFSCKFENGKKVRILTHTNKYEVLIEDNGRFVTPDNDSYSKCPAIADDLKSGKYLPTAEEETYEDYLDESTDSSDDSGT